MATDLKLIRGDTRPVIKGKLKNDDGSTFVLGGSDVVRFRLAPRGGGAPVLTKTAVVVSAPAGEVDVTLAEGDLDIPIDFYNATFEIDVGGTGANIQNSLRLEIEVIDLLAANLLTNPSFESDLTGWTTGNLGGGTIVASTERAFVGVKSCKFTIPSQASDLYASIGQTVAVPAPLRGDSVAVQVRILATILPDAGWGYLVWVRASTDGGVAFPFWLTGSLETMVLNEWVRLTATGTVAANVSHLRVEVLSRRGATMYVDAVQLESGVRATPYRDS